MIVFEASLGGRYEELFSDYPPNALLKHVASFLSQIVRYFLPWHYLGNLASKAKARAPFLIGMYLIHSSPC